MSVNVPSGYKQTKVGVIPEDWEVVKLGEVGQVITGSTPPTNDKSNYGMEYLFVSPADIRQNKYVNNTEKKVSKKGFEISRKVNKGAVLFVCIGSTIGKIAIAAQDLITNQQINAFYSKTYCNEYVFYILSFNSGRIKLLAGEQAVPLLNKSEFSKVKIPLPALREQQKIAQILSTWDDAISKQETLIKAKEALKKVLMQKLLSGEVQFDGFDGEWEEIRLGDIASRITTKNTDNSIDMVFTNSAVNGIVIQNEFFDKDIANRDNLTGYYIVESGDFVYNPRISKHAPSGPINRNRHEFSGIVSPLYTVFRTKDNEVIDYLEYFFSSTLWFRYMKAIANYGARHDRMNITNSDFMKMPIPYPSKEEQQKIAEVLTLADKEIDLLKNELEALKEQKRGLMQRLLSGEIRTVNIKGEE